jgi:hypothetical protein
VSQADLIPLLFLALLGLGLGFGFMVLGWMLAVNRRNRFAQKKIISPPQNLFLFPPPVVRRPESWLAIRAVSPEAVRTALGLNRTEPCSWAEGLQGGHEFFISPRVHGWVIVTGMGLPNPTDDVDATFLFLTALSRQLGHVQYFYASRLLCHHAWARRDDGCVTRAYAWTGETAWNQGTETLPEIEADVRLSGYGEHSSTLLDAETNFEKVPQLAARWSLDPAQVKLNSFHPATGIAGKTAFG